MIKAYLAQMKEELKKLKEEEMKEELEKFKEDDNVSMTSVNSHNSFRVLAGEAQQEDDNDIPIECMIDMIEDQLLHKNPKGKNTLS